MQSFVELCASCSDVLLLGRGGQKEVFSALHKIYGDIVIKLFFQKLDPRSQREIDISKNSKLDEIPRVYEEGDVIYNGIETLYVIEQKIRGQELRKKIKDGEKFDLKKTVIFLEKSLNFVSKLENLSIVHRDIKPENIIITKEGNLFFLDFGIARLLNLPSLTGTKAINGPHTPGYAAPEQFNNWKTEIDSRADIFSVGVVTYECITGINPFSDKANNNIEILNRTEQIQPQTIKIKGDSQFKMSEFIETLISKSLSGRPKNAKQALEWLNNIKPTLEY